MAVIPTGPLWHAYLLELTLADLAEWQALVGAANRDEAREHIHYPWMLNPESGQKVTSANLGLPPRAIISNDADVAPYRRYQKAVGSFVGEDNSLMLAFDIPVPDETYEAGPKDAGYWFATAVGDVMKGLEGVAGKGEAIPAGVVDPQRGYSYLNMQSWSILDGPFELAHDEYTMEWMRDVQIPKYVYHMTIIVEHR